MSMEETNQNNENPSQKMVSSFLDLLENKGYTISDFSKMTSIIEAIAAGNTSPIDRINSLQKLEENLGFGETATSNFRQDMKYALDGLADFVNNMEVKPELNSTEFNDRVRNLKVKLGIVQDYDRVKQAEENRAATKAKLDALGSRTDLSQEQKMAEFRRLTLIYNGPDKAAIDNAKTLTEKASDNTPNGMFDINFINEIAMEIKAISDMVYEG